MATVYLPDFFAKPILSTFFPLVFDNGARWNSLTTQCQKCGVKAGARDTLVAPGKTLMVEHSEVRT